MKIKARRDLVIYNMYKNKHWRSIGFSLTMYAVRRLTKLAAQNELGLSDQVEFLIWNHEINNLPPRRPGLGTACYYIGEKYPTSFRLTRPTIKRLDEERAKLRISKGTYLENLIWQPSKPVLRLPVAEWKRQIATCASQSSFKAAARQFEISDLSVARITRELGMTSGSTRVKDKA
jgi:hypothetical protein